MEEQGAQKYLKAPQLDEEGRGAIITRLAILAIACSRTHCLFVYYFFAFEENFAKLGQ